MQVYNTLHYLAILFNFFATVLWGPFTATDLCEAQAYRTDNVKAFTMTKLLKELIRMLNDKKMGQWSKTGLGIT